MHSFYVWFHQPIINNYYCFVRSCDCNFFLITWYIVPDIWAWGIPGVGRKYSVLPGSAESAVQLLNLLSPTWVFGIDSEVLALTRTPGSTPDTTIDWQCPIMTQYLIRTFNTLSTLNLRISSLSPINWDQSFELDNGKDSYTIFDSSSESVSSCRWLVHCFSHSVDFRGVVRCQVSWLSSESSRYISPNCRTRPNHPNACSA
jgi:hypothetical protein